MGPAVPYAIGAKFAHPDRPAVAFEGDGAMQMNGLAELITVARYWQRWSDPRLVVVVLHNNDLNQVTWELRALGGTPEFVESQALPDVGYADFAGGHVLDIHCDPDVPPIPPHATLEQMTHTAKALIKGDPSRWGVVKQGLKTKAQELLPR
jgi:pyruvate dehydrogenase (quinone)